MSQSTNSKARKAVYRLFASLQHAPAYIVPTHSNKGTEVSKLWQNILKHAKQTNLDMRVSLLGIGTPLDSPFQYVRTH